MALGLSQSTLSAAITGAVGEGAATEFLAFLRLYQELPSVDAIVMAPDSVKIPSSPATIYALAGALANRATPANFDRIARFAERMATENHGEFAVLLVRDALQRTPKIAQTQAFVKLATGELGELVSGTIRS
jgi:hypothetical protein